MTAHARKDHLPLVVALLNGDDDQEEVAETGKQALEIARRMLAECHELCDDDLLLRISRCRPRKTKVATKPHSKGVRQTDG